MLKYYRFPTLFFLLFIAGGYLFLFIGFFKTPHTTTIKSNSYKQGIIDLSSIDFNTYETINLVGTAEFYWQQLLTPGDFKNSTKPVMSGYLPIPGLWNGFKIGDKTLSGNGYATYRILLKVKDDGRYGIRIKEFDCAYRLWANGEMAEAGQVATSKEKMIPSWQRNEVYFNAVNHQVEIIIQLSNFQHWKGGPEDMMTFGKSRNIILYKRQHLMAAYFLTGLFLILTVHYMGIYLFRPVDKSSLLFALLCLTIILRLVTTNEKILLDLFPSFPWNMAIRIEYISYMLTAPLFTAFYHYLFPKHINKLAIRITLYLALLFTAIVITTPSTIFTYTPIVFQFVLLSAGLYLFWRLIAATLQKEEDAWMMLCSYVFLFFITINDFLYYNKLVGSEFFMPVGLFIVVFSQSFVLSKRLSFAFGTVEDLTSKLEDQNRQLERTVEERTLQVIHQKDEIEQQASALTIYNERLIALDKFKEEMMHMIVHDLKNPLNTIIGVTKLQDIPDKDQLVKEAGKQMLNMVLNILDVSKYENSTMIVQRQSVWISGLVQDAIKEVSFVSKQRGVQFYLKMNEDLHADIDKDLMLRVLVNLLTNAVKFSPSNGTIHIVTNTTDRKQLRISVIDQGPGIRPEVQQLIFTPYYTLSQSNSNIKPTGLGLTFCKMVVEAHGGTIGINSQVNMGAEIYFDIPVNGDLISGNTIDEMMPTMSSNAIEADDDRILQAKIQLRRLKVYEISQIYHIIHLLKQQGFPHRHPWLTQLEQAIINCDEVAYELLIR
jgi:signal transduction histidine kinase